MGRAKSKKSASQKAAAAIKSAQPTNATASSSSAPTPGFAIDELLMKAHTVLAQQDYELASRFLERILAQDPRNVEARELLGMCDLELGNVEEARAHFLALTSNPSIPSAAPHLYLAQLSSTPQESLSHFEAAIGILEKNLAQMLADRAASGLPPAAVGEDEKMAEFEMRKQISGAFVGMTEVYLTDLCFDPLAPEKCDLLLGRALEVAPEDPEAWICLASVRMSQEREADARECVGKGWSSWRGRELGDPLTPPLPTRLAITRLQLELESYAEALEVLATVREEDEEDVEGAYLEGWAWYLRGEKAAEAGVMESRTEGEDTILGKKECWEEARESLTVCELLHQAQSHPSPEVLSHVRELLAELDAAGTRAAVGVVDEEEAMTDAAGGAQDWEEDDDDDAMQE